MLDYHSLLDGPTFAEVRPPLPEAPVAIDGPVTVAVRRLRGHHMATREELFDEFAAALQFPAYFAHNLDSFDECLRDVACPEGPDAAVVLAITEPDEVLADAQDDRTWLLEAIHDANAVRRRRDVGSLVVLVVQEDDQASSRWWRNAD